MGSPPSLVVSKVSVDELPRVDSPIARGVPRRVGGPGFYTSLRSVPCSDRPIIVYTGSVGSHRKCRETKDSYDGDDLMYRQIRRDSRFDRGHAPWSGCGCPFRRN